jgi:hypothetical protein
MTTQPAVAAAAPMTGNRRAAVRFPCTDATSGQLRLAGEYVTRRARVVDLSAAGVALRLSRPIAPGTELLLQLHHAELGIRYTLAMCVTQCARLPGSMWLIGCSFARRLSERELRSLL